MLWGLLKQLAQPVLQPVQKIIPPIAGLDLSPVFLLLGLGAVSRMLLGPAQPLAGSFLCPLASEHTQLDPDLPLSGVDRQASGSSAHF